MMKSPSFAASSALLIVSLALGCNAILGTTPGTPEGAGGSGGATSSASAASVSAGAGGATSSASSSSAASSSASSSSASASSSSGAGGGSDGTSTSSGPCTTDEDTDGVISWQCAGGTDCADQDARAHPGAGFTSGVAIIGPRSPGTLPYDFDCDQLETKATPVLACVGALCSEPPSMHGYKQDVACGAAGALGHCSGTPCAWVSDSMTTTEICK